MQSPDVPPVSHGPFMDFFTDYAFKRLLGPGANRQLIDFLNALLADLADPIVDLQYLPQEHLGARREERLAIFDLYCKTDDGSAFIVELQTTRQQHYRERTLYYSTFPIQEQAIRGDWDFRLAPVYCVSLLNFSLEEDIANPEDIVTTVQLRTEGRHVVFYDKLTYVYVELGRFQKTEEELQDHRDWWLYIFKNLATLQTVPPQAREDIFMEFLENAQIAQLSPAEQLDYHRSLKAYRDKINTEAYAKQKGHEEGRKEGLEKGRKEGREEGRKEGLVEGQKQQLLQIVALMRQNGMDDETICKNTGLTQEELAQLEP